MCAGNDMGLSLLRARGCLVPRCRPVDARSRGRCASLARLHLAEHSPCATKCRAPLSLLLQRVRRSTLPTACLTNTPGLRGLWRSGTTIRAAEAGAVGGIRGHFFLRLHRRRFARNIRAQTETRGNGRRLRARGPLQNSARHFPAAANPASSVRCESRRSPNPLLPNFVLPNFVLRNLVLLNPRSPNPRSRNSDKPIRDTETFPPAPSRSTHSRGALQKSDPAGRTRKSDPRPTSHCVAPARGKRDDRLRRPWQPAAPKPGTIPPQFLPRPRLRSRL